MRRLFVLMLVISGCASSSPCKERSVDFEWQVIDPHGMDLERVIEILLDNRNMKLNERERLISTADQIVIENGVSKYIFLFGRRREGRIDHCDGSSESTFMHSFAEVSATTESGNVTECTLTISTFIGSDRLTSPASSEPISRKSYRCADYVSPRADP